jgi:ubiquinone/menaquinone biosynthesis C-methylase UbiE
VTGVDNPFAANDVGVVYDRGRPFHHPRTLGRAVQLLGDVPVERGLDIACGTGMSTVALRTHADIVVGVDVSPEMLRAARRVPGVSYLFARAERLPFSGGSFDAVTCCSGIHWFDQPRFFAELHRVLGPGGWVVLYDHYFFRMRGTPQFREWIEELFARYPLPPRGAAVGDPKAAAAEGFEVVADESFDDDIAMTRDEFADYQLTVSHCVAAADRGTPRDELRAWLLESTEPLFDGAPTKTVRFYAAITCLRRSP